ncbi:MAG: urease accessory protein UreD [Rhodoluna sp.]|nr:urease accessory protein UreD [Rhodoluna sp.]
MAFISIEAQAQRAVLTTRASVLIPRTISQGENRARLALVAGGALLLGGDKVEIEVLVGEGCTLELEDIGGTVAYDADGVESSWSVSITLAENAKLIWHALPMVVADGSNVNRSTRVTLAEGATALLRETIVLGRHGEVGGNIHQRTDVSYAGRPLLIEDLRLVGGKGMPGVIGENRVLDSCLILGERAQAPNALQFELSGSMSRFIGMQTHTSSMDAVWQKWSTEVFQVV